jgi:hypothetical protein
MPRGLIKHRVQVVVAYLCNSDVEKTEVVCWCNSDVEKTEVVVIVRGSAVPLSESTPRSSVCSRSRPICCDDCALILAFDFGNFHT